MKNANHNIIKKDANTTLINLEPPNSHRLNIFNFLLTKNKNIQKKLIIKEIIKQNFM
jgi:hypothetical protein